MERLIINGGKRLEGEARIHGAKNSALPVLAACFAVGKPCVIHNCPRLSDVNAAISILKYAGCRAYTEGDMAFVDSSGASGSDIPEYLMREMRSSISFLGAIISRCGKAELSTPGGCELGARPIDLHLFALERLGAHIEESHGYIRCRTDGRLTGAAIPLSFPSVGATENAMIAAATARGVTVISNAAREPEIADLADFLNSCGARISGAGDSTITIDGVESLHGCRHTVIPDRIEAATYMAAAAVTGGDVILRAVCPEQLMPVTLIMERMGCEITPEQDAIRIKAPARLSSAGYIRTMPFPGFPTDAQAVLMAAAAVADGTGVFVENIFDNRFKHVGELCRLGAKIKTEGRVAVTEGVKRLTGASVKGADLRGTAALMVAGLAADGRTELSGLCHLDRGYESPEKILCSLGADVRRV